MVRSRARLDRPAITIATQIGTCAPAMQRSLRRSRARPTNWRARTPLARPHLLAAPDISDIGDPRRYRCGIRSHAVPARNTLDRHHTRCRRRLGTFGAQQPAMAPI